MCKEWCGDGHIEVRDDIDVRARVNAEVRRPTPCALCGFIDEREPEAVTLIDSIRARD